MEKKLPQDYWLLNVLTVAEAIDLARSDLCWETNDAGKPFIQAVNRLVLRDDLSAGGRLVLRAKEFPWYVIVSGQIVHECRRQKVRDIFFEQCPQ